MTHVRVVRESTAEAFLEHAARAILDGAHHRFAADVPGAARHLIESLADLRAAVSPSSWERLSRSAAVLEHPIRDILHSDPFMRRAFEKPRGYAGDAVLLDYIYSQDPGHETPAVGRAVFEVTTNQPASRAVRHRKDILSGYIDRVAAEHDRPRVLSLACGHLREAEASEAVRGGRVEFVAVDQDPESLAIVDSTLGALGVTALQGSVKDVLKEELTFQDFDLVYAAGLYDYLPQPVARSLTTRLFGSVRAGGVLLVANFLNGIADLGIMETFMDWRLIYRNRAEMLDLAADLPMGEVESITLFQESAENIVFLEVRKSSSATGALGSAEP